MGVALTAGQMIQLSAAMHDYVQDQLAQGNMLVYLSLRTASSDELNKALAPYVTARLASIQSSQVTLATAQAAQVAQTDQLVADLQGLVASLPSV